jgi:hypothetical protein
MMKWHKLIFFRSKARNLPQQSCLASTHSRERLSNWLDCCGGSFKMALCECPIPLLVMPASLASKLGGPFSLIKTTFRENLENVSNKI